jgi:hypothetical protein
MAGGGGHNKRDGNRYEDRGAEVELLVLGKLFEALVENRNQLKSEKSLNTRKHHACLLDGLAASLIRLLVQLPRPMAQKSIVHVSVFQGAQRSVNARTTKAMYANSACGECETKCSNIPTAHAPESFAYRHPRSAD